MVCMRLAPELATIGSGLPGGLSSATSIDNPNMDISRLVRLHGPSYDAQDRTIDFSDTTGPLRIRQPQPRRQMGSQNAILCHQILALDQQLLIDQASNVRQQSYPFVFFHLDRP